MFDKWKLGAVAVTVTVAALSACTPPNVSDPAVRRNITQCWGNGTDVELTFDDFGNAANVNSIIDVLNRANVKGTFFPVGYWAQANPWLIARMAMNGHRVGNHTYDHRSLPSLSDAGINYEIDNGPQPPQDQLRLLRPPYGDGAFTQRINNLAAARNYLVCYWTVDTQDWAGRSAAEITSSVRYGTYYTPPVRAGGVVLMHMSAPHTLEALPGVIVAIRSMGLHLLPLH